MYKIPLKSTYNKFPNLALHPNLSIAKLLELRCLFALCGQPFSYPGWVFPMYVKSVHLHDACKKIINGRISFIHTMHFNFTSISIVSMQLRVIFRYLSRQPNNYARHVTKNYSCEIRDHSQSLKFDTRNILYKEN